MQRLGLIAGTVFFEHDEFRDSTARRVETPYGTASVYVGDRLVFLPRHGTDMTSYVMPHRINHPANIAALKEMGVGGIVAVNSTGSLRRAIPPGTILVPDDFISFFSIPSIFQDRPGHVAPLLDAELRRALVRAGREEGVPVVDGGVYWQNPGPRLETRAEIRLMAHFADVVGMTLGSEATIAAEMDVPFAAVCSVDNYANGIIDAPLSEAVIRESAARHAASLARIVRRFLEIWEHGPEEG